jgi:hypothetical protein
MHGNGRGVTEMLDKEDVVLGRGFGGSNRGEEDVGRRRRERDSEGSEGNLVRHSNRDSGRSERFEMADLTIPEVRGA